MPKIVVPIFLALFLFTACVSSEREMAIVREKKAQKASGDIRIALVWQEKLFKSYFYQGVDLAVEEINKAGGIKGRKIRTVRYNNEDASLERDLDLARRIAADTDAIAVIGHYLEEGSVMASVTYENSGLLYISPAASSLTFSRHDFHLVFRNTPSDRENGAKLAEFVKKMGFTDILVLDDRTVYGRGLSDIFHERASHLGLNIVARRSYDWLGTDFKPFFAEVKSMHFDAIFLGGSIPTAGEVIKQARVMGVKAPFFGGSAIDSPTLWDIAGKAAEGTTIPTTFHPDKPYGEARKFSHAFHAKYGVRPDTSAGQGYDAIGVLAASIKRAGTTVPVVVASFLRFLENWQGVIGKYSFTKEGDVVGDIIDFQVLHDGRFELIEGGLP